MGHDLLLSERQETILLHGKSFQNISLQFINFISHL